MNNFIDTTFDTTQTENKMKYTLTYADGTEELVQLSIATPVETLGTALNKLFFDSIRDDLNSRLLTANKATQSQAEAGTNNTNYMTPLRVQNKVSSMTTNATVTTTSTSTVTTTLLDLTNIADKIYDIDIHFQKKGSGTGDRTASLTLNGTSIVGASVQNGTYSQVASTTAYSYVAASNTVDARESTLHLHVNTITKTIDSFFMYGVAYSGQNITQTGLTYSTLTTLELKTKARSSTQYPVVTYTIKVNK